VAHLRLRARARAHAGFSSKRDRDEIRSRPALARHERIEFPVGRRRCYSSPLPQPVRQPAPAAAATPDRRSLRDPCGLQTSRSFSLSPAIAIARHALSRERKHARISCNLHPRPPAEREREREREKEGVHFVRQGIDEKKRIDAECNGMRERERERERGGKKRTLKFKGGRNGATAVCARCCAR